MQRGVLVVRSLRWPHPDATALVPLLPRGLYESPPIELDVK